MAVKSKMKGLAWFVAGLGVGALVGILFAPKSGRENREDLVNDAREQCEGVAERGRSLLSEYIDDAYDESTDDKGPDFTDDEGNNLTT